ncbi:MAG: hypothetical protein ABJH68_04855 [Ilumatobacter sp.]|uniref:HalD/BesD family halogenase n=1 Tax=Ilumatobacter sp. TaxID=1967498 RepID=UPI0032982780
MTTTLHELLANPEAGDLTDVIDLDRYPIHEPGSRAWCELLDRAHERLDDDGCLVLDGFLLPAALRLAAEEIGEMASHVSIRRHSSTVYARKDIEMSLPADDPRIRALTWHAGHVTRDMIPPYTVAHRVYASSYFKAFVAACTRRERVFEYADPLAGLVATVLPPTGAYPWHYDTNEYVATIMTRKPDVGGTFEYCADLRGPDSENLAGLADVLSGDHPEMIRSVEIEPGDLQLFLGRYSLHQVTPTAGVTDRHVMVFSYADRPGVIGPVDRTRAVYGRVTEAHLVAEALAAVSADGLIL